MIELTFAPLDCKFGNYGAVQFEDDSKNHSGVEHPRGEEEDCPQCIIMRSAQKDLLALFAEVQARIEAHYIPILNGEAPLTRITDSEAEYGYYT